MSVISFSKKVYCCNPRRKEEVVAWSFRVTISNFKKDKSNVASFCARIGTSKDFVPKVLHQHMKWVCLVLKKNWKLTVLSLIGRGLIVPPEENTDPFSVVCVHHKSISGSILMSISTFLSTNFMYILQSANVWKYPRGSWPILIAKQSS